MHAISSIRVTGPDAFEFLQGQLTNDLRRLASETEILAAWCNPKGRVIWFGPVRAIGDGYSLAAPADMAEEIVRRLSVFRFRSKVEFEVRNEGATVDSGSLIQRGQAFIGRQQTEQFTPHMLNLDLLDAISLDKGCYTGQEIVARTHYKGATKRRTLRFASDTPVTIGAKVSDGSRDIGEVINVSGTDLLAVVPVDRKDDRLSVSGVAISLQGTPHVTLD